MMIFYSFYLVVQLEIFDGVTETKGTVSERMGGDLGNLVLDSVLNRKWLRSLFSNHF